MNSQSFFSNGLFLFSLYLDDNSALPHQFQQNLYCELSDVQKLVSDIKIYYLKRAAARRAALFVIARYGEGDLVIFPRDLIKLIARQVWGTREDPVWMDASE